MLCTAAKQYILQQVSEQVNRKCPIGTSSYKFYPLHRPYPSNSPLLEQQMLVLTRTTRIRRTRATIASVGDHLMVTLNKASDYQAIGQTDYRTNRLSG